VAANLLLLIMPIRFAKKYRAAVVLFLAISTLASGLKDPSPENCKGISDNSLGDTHQVMGESIPFSELGARAEQEANGAGVSVVPTPTGAELSTRFQHLAGEVNERGLWICSTAPGEESRNPFQFVHPFN
jgi:hypothetical protein